MDAVVKLPRSTISPTSQPLVAIKPRATTVVFASETTEHALVVMAKLEARGTSTLVVSSVVSATPVLVVRVNHAPFVLKKWIFVVFAAVIQPLVMAATVCQLLERSMTSAGFVPATGHLVSVAMGYLSDQPAHQV